MSQIDIKATEPLVKEQLTLLIERETRYRLDDILQRMQELAKLHQIGGGGQRSPLRNLLVAATDRTASLEIIKNFINYQTARSEDVSRILQKLHEGKKFGKALIDALDELEEDSKTILDSITNGLPDGDRLRQYLTPEIRSREIIDLHLKLAQFYLGYLVREHTALGKPPNSSTPKFEAEKKTDSDPMARPDRPSGDNRSQKPNPKRR